VRNNRFILITIFIFFFFVLIGYFEPMKDLTTTSNKLEIKESNKIATNNIKTFAKLYGYIRYFHPSDEASEIDWNNFAVYGIQQVTNAKDSNELKSTLEKLFSPIAPTIQIYTIDENPKAVEGEVGSQLTAWQHLGLGVNNNPNSIYQSKRIVSDSNVEITLFDKTYSPKTIINKSLNSELKAQIPIVLYKNDKGTLGGTEESQNEYEELKYNLKYVGRDPVTKYLANTVITWNVFQHFYPDFEVLDISWEKELETTLTNILNSKEEQGYEKSFQFMLDKIADGHIEALAKPIKNNYLPLSLDWIENELIVTASDNNLIFTGDRILKINGTDSKEFVAQIESEMSGSEPWKKHQAIKEVLSAESPETELSLEINRDGNVLDKVKLKYDWYNLDDFNRSDKEALYELENGIYYINQSLINDYQFRINLDKLSAAKGIIIDLRGYQEEFKVGIDIISHIIDTSVKSPIIQVPKIIYPDQEEMEFETIQWSIEPQSPRLTAKIVYLTYGGAIGESELFLEIVKKYNLAELVGEQTAGENLGANTIQLFDTSDKIYWTGSKLLKHDGTQHHLIGVKPTYTVERTLEAVKLGKDEYIEKALEVINSK
jgi:C-terminal processing protease CtpA/Prc